MSAPTKPQPTSIPGPGVPRSRHLNEDERPVRTILRGAGAICGAATVVAGGGEFLRLFDPSLDRQAAAICFFVGCALLGLFVFICWIVGMAIREWRAP